MQKVVLTLKHTLAYQDHQLKIVLISCLWSVLDWCPYIAGGELEAKQTEPGDWQYSVLPSNRSNKENGHHQYMDIMNIDQYSLNISQVD